MRTVLRFFLGALLAAWLPGAALAATDNYQGLWWNAPPGSESGWGMNVAHQGDAIMATWFTYDATGNGLWLVMVATRSPDGTYAGTVYETSGPSFAAVPFEPAWVTRLAVGNGTLAFTDAAHGTFRYAVRGVQATKAITREVFGPLPDCSAASQPELANATNYTDLWWSAQGAESGWGINFEHQGDVLFATWFTYDRFGAPMWLAATAPRISGNVFGGTLIRTTGPAFSAPAFDPALVTRTAVGTATITFAHGNAATFTYTMDGVTRTKALSRELFAPPAATACRAAPGATIQGRVFEGAAVAALVCADTNGNARCDPGEPQVATDAGGAYALAAPAGYAGALVAEVSGYRMASPGRDYSVNITPYTTLVQLTGEPDLAIAEMRVRNELGLPQRFAIRLAAPPAEGSLAQSVARSLVAALKNSPDLSGPQALSRVVGAFPPALTQLPQLRITTKAGAAIDSKEVYVDATFELTNPAAATPLANLSGKIRGRGNVTWLQPKKPYKVQFASDTGWSALPDVLGMKKNRNWALLADYLDRALMRNQLAFTLANSSLFAEGLKWSPSTVRLEVWVNGEYQGLYTLTEDIRVDPMRLDIKKIGVNDMDGGYIVEVDYPLDCYDDGTLCLKHETPQDVHVCVKTPDEGSATLQQLAWVKSYLDAAEHDLYEHGSIAGLNAASFADWYLLNEYFRNYDAAFYSSDYMWKDSASAAVPADRLLNMGPPWDFDITAGNVNVEENWRPQGCWVNKSRDLMPNWYTKLLDNRDFLDLVIARWKDKRAGLARLTGASIATYTRRLEAAQAQNFGRWPLLGETLWIDPFTFRTWREHVDYLKAFFDQRLIWMDQAFASPQAYATLCK